MENRKPELSLSVSGREGPLTHDVCAYSDILTFRVTCPGMQAGSIRIFRDDDGTVLFLPLQKEGDRFCVTVPAETFCADKEKSGLAYYRFETETENGHAIFSKAADGFDPVLRYRDENIAAFQLTVTEDGYDTPKWLRGGILYHIFVDRFCKGENTRIKAHGAEIPVRSDAEYNPDWYEGIPQHAKIPGGFVKNNEFFGGTLWGVAEKLPYLCSLGVTAIYLSPVFRAYSNHKYDTGDYESVDPGFGGDEALSYLLKTAKNAGIRVILDGVFNHTGDDSRYFNKKGTYPSCGAYQSENSPYYPWYTFRGYPDDYACWWNIETLPAVKTGSEDVRRYFLGEDGIIAKWMKTGISGWRLDVADELDDRFLCDLRTRVKTEDPDAMIYGEVWEDASYKISYGKRRRYFRGAQLDSVMNYPFRTGILSYLKTGNAEELADTVYAIVRHYPAGCVHTLMNFLGTHDTERVLTCLAGEDAGERDNDELAHVHMTEEERERGKKLLRFGALLCYTLPGVPCVYYGDEAGVEGYRDPYNRRPYPWGREDGEILSWYRLLGRIRRENTVLADGEYQELCRTAGVYAFERKNGDETLLIAVNLGRYPYSLPAGKDLLTGEIRETNSVLAPGTCAALRLSKK